MGLWDKITLVCVKNTFRKGGFYDYTAGNSFPRDADDNKSILIEVDNTTSVGQKTTWNCENNKQDENCFCRFNNSPFSLQCASTKDLSILQNSVHIVFSF